MTYEPTYICPYCGDNYQDYNHKCELLTGSPHASLFMAVGGLNQRLNAVEKKLDELVKQVDDVALPHIKFGGATMTINSNYECGYGPNPKQKLQVWDTETKEPLNNDTPPFEEAMALNEKIAQEKGVTIPLKDNVPEHNCGNCRYKRKQTDLQTDGVFGILLPITKYYCSHVAHLDTRVEHYMYCAAWEERCELKK